jgi:DNA-directed RNA polymerase specialized sigma24 family protein
MSVEFGGGCTGDDLTAEALRNAGHRVFAHLYENYAARLFDYCAGVIGDELAAVMAVEESLVAVDAQIGTLPDPHRLRVSLYAEARHHCLSKLSGLRIEPSGSSETTTSDQPVADQLVAEQAAADPEAAAVGRDTMLVVAAALARMAGGDREVLNLVFRHGIEGAELAAVIGVSPRRARAMQSDAGARFRKSAAVVLVRRGGVAGDRAFGPEMLADLPLAKPPLTLRMRITLALGSYRHGGAGLTGGPGDGVVPARRRAGSGAPRPVVVASLGLVVLGVLGALLYKLVFTSPATSVAAQIDSGILGPAPGGSSLTSPGLDPQGSVRQQKPGPFPGLLGPTPLGVLPIPSPHHAGPAPTPAPPHNTPPGPTPPTTSPPTTPPTTTPPTTTPPTTTPPTTPPPTTPPPTTPPPTTPPPTPTATASP